MSMQEEPNSALRLAAQESKLELFLPLLLCLVSHTILSVTKFVRLIKMVGQFGLAISHFCVLFNRPNFRVQNYFFRQVPTGD